MEEIDLKEIFSMFWNRKLAIFIIVLVFLILGCIYTLKFTTPIYSSSITMILVSSSNQENQNTIITSTDINLNKKLITTYIELIKSDRVLNQVITSLNLEGDANKLRSSLTVASVPNTDLIKITVKDQNPKESTKMANEIAKVFTEQVKELYNISNVQMMDEAGVPTKPSNINHQKDILIFSLAGILFSGIYVVILNLLDNTIKTAEDIENEYHLSVLASIPDYENK